MHHRQQQILGMLQRGRIEYRAAARELGVTEMTVRRRCEPWNSGSWLCGEGRRDTVSVADRLSGAWHRFSTGIKMALAEALYARLQPLDSLFIGTGTTALCLPG